MYPLFCFAEGVIPAASVWTGSRLWVEAFRAAGLSSGDRIVVALPPSGAWLQVFVAAIWEGLTLALVPEPRSATDVTATMTAADARAAVIPAALPVLEDAADTSPRMIFRADPFAGPVSTPGALREVRFAPTPDARFFLRTSGTGSDDGRWIALSDENVLAVVDSHLSRLGLEEETSRVLSALPWSHAFGLVIALLPALLTGAEIHRDPDGGRNVESLLDTFAGAGITDFCAVPLTIKRLVVSERGRDFLRSLRGGVVGGAPVDEAATEFLRATRLRVGYGQTEASPGIALGEPGDFPAARYLGKTLGCETRLRDGVLLFRGANACYGMWSAQTGLTTLGADRWHDTGDLVTRAPDGDLFFAGRCDSAFKLANGRRIEAELLENALRAEIPGLENLLLYTADGETLEAAADVALDLAAVTAALGSAGRLVCSVRLVAPSSFVYTPKGTLRRAATLANLLAARD